MRQVSWMDTFGAAGLRSYQRSGAEFLASPPDNYRGRILADPRVRAALTALLIAVGGAVVEALSGVVATLGGQVPTP